MRVDEHTRRVLEWDGVLAALAERCDAEPSRERARTLVFYTDPDALRAELSRVSELVRLAQDGVDVLPIAFADVRPALARAEREGLLSGPELFELAELLRVALRTRRHLTDQRERAPLCAAIAEELDPLPALVREIESCIDARGEVSDDATPELTQLRERHRSLQTRTKTRIDEMLHSQHFEHLLQDNYVTVREGRYVLPFVASVHRQLNGIVHHRSQSGATAFMETPELVDLNNRLTVSALDVEREVERVLRELTVSVCAEVETLGRDLELLAKLDLVHAKARLCHDLGGTIPDIDDARPLVLRHARHPMMVLAGRTVRSNNLELGAARGLVITGPNTGGKTVSMKTMGLSAMMAAAGLPVCAGAGSTSPLYSSVCADIGDEQSIERSLSTFSGHLVHIATLLAGLDARSLVLLDELCVGTDPVEGAALATAIMETIVAAGASLVLTTHYEELKAKAHIDPRFINASFGYDPATFAPSYAMTSGVPGRSGAIEVASRLGLPQGVIGRARALIGDRGQLDQVIAALEKERVGLHAAREAVRAQEVALERERQRVNDQERELAERKRAAYEAARVEMLAELERTREEVRSAVRALQAAPSHEAVAKVRAQADAAEKVVQAHRAAPAPEPVAPVPVAEAPLQVGDRVFVTTFGRNGKIAELNARKAQATVDFGGAKVVVPLSALRAVEPESVGGGARFRPAARVSVDDDSPARTQDTTCDLRGMRADDAVAAAEAFLDRALGADKSVVWFIHGHGTGALKTALRKFLRDSEYVRRSREGRRDEGGDGVTLAWLAEG